MTNASSGIPRSLRSAARAPGAASVRVVRSSPSRITQIFDSGAIPRRTRSSRTSGETAISASLAFASPRSSWRKPSVLTRAEVAAKDVAVECVHDDLRAGSPGEERGDAPDRSRLGRVRMQDMGTELANETEHLRDGCGVDDRRDLALERRHVDGCDPTLTGCVLHRALALRHPAGDEERLVADPIELARQIGDVEGGAADVQPGDDTQNSDRLLCHRKKAMRASLRSFGLTFRKHPRVHCARRLPPVDAV